MSVGGVGQVSSSLWHIEVSRNSKFCSKLSVIFVWQPQVVVFAAFFFFLVCFVSFFTFHSSEMSTK